jgi:hypothetical protein
VPPVLDDVRTVVFIQDWSDSRLRWRVEDYDNLSDVVVKPERIWLPELALMNGYRIKHNHKGSSWVTQLTSHAEICSTVVYIGYDVTRRAG